MRLLSLYLLAILLLSSSVQAREEFWYMGVGGGVTFLDDKDDAFTSIEEKSTVAKAYLGYRASTYLAFEMEYAHLGTYEYQRSIISEEAELSTLGISIVVMYPLVVEELELYTPLSWAVMDADYVVQNEFIGTYKLGFGIAYTPTESFTIRLGTDVTVFELESSGETYKQNLVSAYTSLQYNF